MRMKLRQQIRSIICLLYTSNAGADKPIGKWFVPLGKYVLVPLSLVALIAGALLGGDVYKRQVKSYLIIL